MDAPISKLALDDIAEELVSLNELQKKLEGNECTPSSTADIELVKKSKAPLESKFLMGVYNLK